MSVFERQRLELESRLGRIVESGDVLDPSALKLMNGALDDLVLDSAGYPTDRIGSDTRGLVEHALCRLAHGVVANAARNKTPVMNTTLPRVLDLSLTLSETGTSDPGSVFVVLQNVLETSTVEECSGVFGWVERVRERLGCDTCWKRGKLTLLRACNDLTRRLSIGKIDDVVLRGRVSLLLSAMYPLSERSALNISGAYNDGHGVALGTVDATALGVEEENGQTTSPAGAAASTDASVSTSFYATFWNLQSFFKNPQVASGVDEQGTDNPGWNAFRESLDAVLDTFETRQLDQSSAAEVEAAKSAMAFASGGNDINNNKTSSNSPGVKYLTSVPLLRLQVQDANFRRHFLTQCAVFLNHREEVFRGAMGKQSEGENEKEKDKEKLASDRKIETETSSLRKRVFFQLRQTPPAGTAFAKALDLALRREKHWRGVDEQGTDNPGWNAFRESLDAVLDTFETRQLDQSSAAEVEAAKSAMAFASGGNDINNNKTSSNSPGVKYLTSVPLLRLQVQDANFRRHFLTQCAVFLNHREEVFRGAMGKQSEGENEKEKDKEKLASDRKIETETSSLRKRVFFQLRQTPPAGTAFAKALDLALRREKHWSAWKREACKPFERERDPDVLEEEEGVSDDTNRSSKRVKLGNPELDRLWNLSETNQGALLGEGNANDGTGKQYQNSHKQSQPPNSKKFLEEVYEDGDPEADIEETYKRKNDAAFKWKMTRLLAAENISAFIKLASEDVEQIAAEVLGEKPWPKPVVKVKEPDKKEKMEVEQGKEDTDSPKEDADSPAETKNKGKKVQKTKTKTGGGEHLRFADGDATTEERGGDDSDDMGSDSGDEAE